MKTNKKAVLEGWVRILFWIILLIIALLGIGFLFKKFGGVV